MKLLGTGNIADLGENGSLTWCSDDVWEFERLKNNNKIPSRHLLSPATSSQDCLRISHKLHIKTNDQRLKGGRPGATKPPTVARYFCFVCQTAGQLYQRERTVRSQSVSIVPPSLSLSLSLSLHLDTKYVSGQLQLVRAWCSSCDCLYLCHIANINGFISPRLPSPLSSHCDKKNTDIWGFCFRSSAELSVYKDTTLTSTAFCPASNITLLLTDRISFPLQLYFLLSQLSSLQSAQFWKINLSLQIKSHEVNFSVSKR